MEIIFQESPLVTLGTNTFLNCPTILQYGHTPLIEVRNFENAGYTTAFSIFHPDGTKIAVVRGARLFLTDEGKRANLKLRFPKNYTVCELNGQPLFELHRDGPAALNGSAELYTYDGILIRNLCLGLNPLTESGDLSIDGHRIFRDCHFKNCDIAIQIVEGEYT